MQYRLNTNINNKEKVGTIFKSDYILSVCLLLSSFLISRTHIIININNIDTQITLFGICYLICIMINIDRRDSTMLTLIGTFAGYASNLRVLDSSIFYMILITASGLVNLLLIQRVKKVYLEYINFFIVGATIFIYEFIKLNDINKSLIITSIQLVTCVVFYYILKYAVNALENVQVSMSMSSDEILSTFILMAFIINGIGSVKLLQFDINTILSLAFVFVVAYSGGSTYGSMAGVAIGVVSGISNSNILFGIAFYSIGGFIVGIFKNSNKIMSVLSCLFIYFIMGMYSGQIGNSTLLDIMIATILFLLIPKSIYTILQRQMSIDKVRSIDYVDELESIKEEFNLQIQNLTSAIGTVSEYIGETNEKGELEIKTKSESLVQSLANRSCEKCIHRQECWDDNFNSTFMAFQEAINNYETNKEILPEYLKDGCIKHTSIIKNVEQIVDKYNSKERAEREIIENRQILSKHVQNIGNMLKGMLSSFKNKVNIVDDLDKIIGRRLKKDSIKYNDIICYTDSKGHLRIKLEAELGENYDYYSKRIESLVSEAIKIKVVIGSSESVLKSSKKMYKVILEEAPKYYVRSYAAMKNKTGENQTGDYYSFGKMTDGSYMSVISDGMGSGAEAHSQSKATVNLVENLMDVGFDEDSVVSTINSIIGARFSEKEQFSTLDLMNIDLFTGNSKFIKIGSAPSFIKRGNEVIRISSNNIPFGVVDKIDLNIEKYELKAGDIIVSVSDGILDINKHNAADDKWIEEFLKRSTLDPVKLSKDIIDNATNNGEDRVNDDMTVVVSKIYVAE